MRRLADGTYAQDLHPATLWTLLKAELAAGVFGLRLFVAAVAVAAGMLGTVWLLADGLTTALADNGKRMLGGDVAVGVINRPLEANAREELARLGQVSEVVELRTSARAEALRAAVERLLAEKRAGTEGGRTAPVPAIHAFIRTELEGLEGRAADLPRRLLPLRRPGCAGEPLCVRASPGGADRGRRGRLRRRRQ